MNDHADDDKRALISSMWQHTIFPKVCVHRSFLLIPVTCNDGSDMQHDSDRQAAHSILSSTCHVD